MPVLKRSGRPGSLDLNSGCQSPASSGGESVTNLTQWREISPTEFTMHTRAEREMLPYRQPARGAAARFASLNIMKAGKRYKCI